MKNTVHANGEMPDAEMQKAASRLKLSAAEMDEMAKLGVTAEELTAMEMELAPLHARYAAAAPGSKEEEEATDALVRAILRG